ncbi:MAG: hypothetical protein LUD41_01820 [Phascolarctobacterium sp.]|nr:hypothetical protein [Phascolarctobacterium sp.]
MAIGAETAVGTFDITAGQNGIDMEDVSGSALTINAGTVGVKRSGSNTGGSGIIIGAIGTSAADPNTLEITAGNITIDGFRNGIYNEGNSSVTINQTAEGGSLDISNLSFAGVEAHGGSTVINSDGTINITGDGSASYGIYSSAEEAVAINSSGDINISGMSSSVGSVLHADAVSTSVDAADAITIQGLNGKNVNSLTISGGNCGIWNSSVNGIRISDVNAMIISGSSYGICISKESGVTISDIGTLDISDTSLSIFPNAANAVSISNAEAVNFTGNTAMDIYTTTENSMAIDNVKTVTFKDNKNQGIYSGG